MSDTHPVRQVVVIGIAVVKKTSELNNQPPGIGARPARVPAHRPPSDEARHGLHVPQDVRSLDFLRNKLIVDPPLTVTGDLETAAGQLGRDRRISLQRHANRIHRRGDAALAQNPHDLPETHAAAVFEIRLHIEVARIRQGLTAHVRQYEFRVRVTMQNVVFPAFLVVENH